MNLEKITIELVPGYTGFNEQSVQSYFRAKYTLLPLIKDRIIDPFEEILKKQTGFNNDL